MSAMRKKRERNAKQGYRINRIEYRISKISATHILSIPKHPVHLVPVMLVFE